MKTCNLNQYYQVNVNHLLSTRLDAEISKEFFEAAVKEFGDKNATV